MRRIVGDNPTSLKLTVMADAERTDYHEDILPKNQSVIDMVRVATYIHQVPTALEMVKDAHDKGYETTINLMAVSTVPEYELNEGLEMLARSETRPSMSWTALARSTASKSSTWSASTSHYCKAAGKEVGMHAHNNLQLGFANTIEAIVLGANMLDATMAGLGRGAGNCPIELLIGFLHNPRYDLLPVLRWPCRTRWNPCAPKLLWGFDLPYMLTGFLNQHPRSAIKFKESKTKGDIADFYNEIWE